MFPTDGQFEPFDAFASHDKILISRPGPHAGAGDLDEPHWRLFIAGNLRNASPA